VDKRTTQINLSKAWNSNLIKKLDVGYKKGGIDYVEHTQVVQRLIALIPDVKLEMGNLIYDKFTDPNTGEEKDIVTGVIYTISGTIDGSFRTVTEVGMCDKPFYNPDPTKQRKIHNNGERAKECISDAIKRCGMRLGIGIELYDTQAWLVDYLEPKSKVDPKDQQISKPEPKKENETIGAIKVDLENIDKVVKDLSEKKSVPNK